jgi:hypothetical protein
MEREPIALALVIIVVPSAAVAFLFTTQYLGSSDTLSLSGRGNGTPSSQIVVPSGGQGRTFYVAPTGNNENPGTRAQPWGTFGYASRQLHPGDTLTILGGRYILHKDPNENDVIKPPSGNATAWVTIKGEEGNRPVLAGRDNLNAAIDFWPIYISDDKYADREYIMIQNIEITSDNGAQFQDGISGYGHGMNHVILQDLYIHHVDGMGIDVANPNDLKIINCAVTYCGGGAIGGPHGDYGGWRNVLIDHCALSYSGHYYQGGNGDNRPYDRPDGFGIEPANGPIEITHCTAEHNRGDGLDSKSNNTYIHHCIVANNNCDGVKLWGGGSKVENTLVYGRGDGDTRRTDWAPIVIAEGAPNRKFEIVNVAVDDALGGNYLMYANYGVNTPVDLVVRNTIFYGRGESSPIYIGDGVHYTLENNLFWMPKTDHVLELGGKSYTSSQVTTVGTGNKCGDPLFVVPAWGTTGDYHLQPNSPAIDSGTATGAPATDLDGKTRPQGKGFDIGAYEYGGR